MEVLINSAVKQKTTPFLWGVVFCLTKVEI